MSKSIYHRRLKTEYLNLLKRSKIYYDLPYEQKGILTDVFKSFNYDGYTYYNEYQHRKLAGKLDLFARESQKVSPWVILHYIEDGNVHELSFEDIAEAERFTKFKIADLDTKDDFKVINKVYCYSKFVRDN